MKKVRSKSRPTEIGVIKTFSLSPDDEVGEIAVECTGCTYYYNNLAELCEKWEDAPEEEIQVYIEGIQEVHSGGGRVFIDFATAKEAEKAVEKLKAWKRLNDKGFRFTGWYVSGDTTNTIRIYAEFPDAELGPIVGRDLDLILGGEE